RSGPIVRPPRGERARGQSAAVRRASHALLPLRASRCDVSDPPGSSPCLCASAGAPASPGAFRASRHARSHDAIAAPPPCIAASGLRAWVEHLRWSGTANIVHPRTRGVRLEGYDPEPWIHPLSRPLPEHAGARRHDNSSVRAGKIALAVGAIAYAAAVVWASASQGPRGWGLHAAGFLAPPVRLALLAVLVGSVAVLAIATFGPEALPRGAAQPVEPGPDKSHRGSALPRLASAMPRPGAWLLALL